MAAEKKPNPLFDLLNALFTDKNYIQNLTYETCKQNMFMVNRRLAIQYPLQAQVFNNSHINPKDTIKFWSNFLYTGRYAPRWIYTAGAAKSKATTEAKKVVTDAMVKRFCNYYKYSMKDVYDALKFFPEQMTAEILDFEQIFKQMNSNE